MTNRKKQLSLFSTEHEQSAQSKARGDAPRKEARVRKQAKLSFRLAELPEDRREPTYDLKELRELRNWSLDDVHRKTKIPVKHLVALEAGNRTFLPSINVRAFLRTLGRLYEVEWELLLPPQPDTETKVDIKTLDEVMSDETENAEHHWAAPMIDSYLRMRRWVKNFGKKREKRN